MSENSGSGKGTNGSQDPTLEENAGKGTPGSRGGDQTPGADTDFKVAADHDAEGGKRSPSARGRGEAGADENAPNIS